MRKKSLKKQPGTRSARPLSAYFKDVHRGALSAAAVARNDPEMHARMMASARAARLYFAQHRSLGD